MSPAVDVLLGLAVAAQWICCIGLVVMRTPADRLHYTSAGYTVGPFCVLAAILVQAGLTSNGLDSIATVAIMFLSGPLVVHATARALRRNRLGDVSTQPQEKR